MIALHSGLPKARTLFALSSLLALLVFSSAWADGEELTAEVVEGDTQVSFEPTYSATLKQLGANYVMNLRGIEGSDSVSFDVRADQVVTDARLQLEYSYSPALIPELSQLNVLVNDQVAASLALPK